MKISTSKIKSLKKGISKIKKIKAAAKEVYKQNETALTEAGISKEAFVNRITAEVAASKSYSLKSFKEQVKVYNNVINLGEMSGLSWDEMTPDMRATLMSNVPTKKRGNRYKDYETGKFMSKKAWKEKWGNMIPQTIENNKLVLLNDDTGEVYKVPSSELSKFTDEENQQPFNPATAEYVGYGSDGKHENYEILEDENGNYARHYYSTGVIVTYD